jgi:hypothetical protein
MPILKQMQEARKSNTRITVRKNKRGVNNCLCRFHQFAAVFEQQPIFLKDLTVKYK